MKNKNSFDIVKIKGLLGISLFIILYILAKTYNLDHLTYNVKYWVELLGFLFSGFCIWLASDYVKRWFGQ